MKLSFLKNIEWIKSEELNCYIGIDQNLPSNKFADVVYAKISGLNTLKKHFHIRPDESGYESFFFFQGAHINVHLENTTQEINSDKPFHLTFENKEIHSVENLSKNDLLFEVLCAPKHKQGEEVMLN